MSSTADKPVFKETLNLPQTEIPIRAGLAKIEPEILKQWEDTNLYQKLMEKNTKSA